MPCVGRNCHAWYIPQNPLSSNQAERIECTDANCQATFCLRCKQPYHYHSSCDEALEIEAQWLHFMDAGHDDLLVQGLKVDQVLILAIISSLSLDCFKGPVVIVGLIGRIAMSHC